MSQDRDVGKLPVLGAWQSAQLLAFGNVQELPRSGVRFIRNSQAPGFQNRTGDTNDKTTSSIRSLTIDDLSRCLHQRLLKPKLHHCWCLQLFSTCDHDAGDHNRLLALASGFDFGRGVPCSHQPAKLYLTNPSIHERANYAEARVLPLRLAQENIHGKDLHHSDEVLHLHLHSPHAESLPYKKNLQNTVHLDETSIAASANKADLTGSLDCR